MMNRPTKICPLEESVVGLKGYQIERLRGHRPVEIWVRPKQAASCPHCKGNSLRKKARYRRWIRHENQGLRPTYLVVEACKYLCRGCGRYFNERLPGVRPWHRASEPYRRYVYRQHYEGICRRRLALREGIATATVERWYQHFVRRRVLEREGSPCPRVLGIDEHFFTRKKGFATTLCDLAHHRVYDVVLGRSESSLERYFSRLKGRDQVRVVCMDLATGYRRLVRRFFPNAKIVADRFHVVRLVNQHFLNCWRQIDPIGARHRGLLSLMRRHQNRLSPEQQVRLKRYLAQHPALQAIYAFKQHLCGLLCKKAQTARECRQLIPQLRLAVHQLRTSCLEGMVQLGQTLHSWMEPIVRMWRFTKSNGITEGFHNKMETLQRNAYGFRNFENYRLRVRALCG